FGGLEKGTAFYLASPLFWLKMVLFATVVLLEVWPMVTFIRWRRALRRGEAPDTGAAPRLHVINHVQMGLVVVIVFVASFTARGIGPRSTSFCSGTRRGGGGVMSNVTRRGYGE